MNVTLIKWLSALSACFLTLASPAFANTYWSDGFESGDFSHWSYVQGQSTAQGGPGPNYVKVITPQTIGIPAQSGNYVAQFQLPPALEFTYPHAKIYKEWSATGKKDQFGRVEDTIFNNGDVSGIYVAWYYFPANYVPSTDWVNIFFFKEEGLITAGGAQAQNPSWWLNIAPAGTFGNTLPVIFANFWGNSYVNFHPKTVALPRGRWFKISANLYSGNKIDWYIDGVKFDTSYSSTWPVGRFFYNSTGWVFGVGHYQGNGVDYIDNVSVNSIGCN